MALNIITTTGQGLTVQRTGKSDYFFSSGNARIYTLKSTPMIELEDLNGHTIEEEVASTTINGLAISDNAQAIADIKGSLEKAGGGGGGGTGDASEATLSKVEQNTAGATRTGTFNSTQTFTGQKNLTVFLVSGDNISVNANATGEILLSLSNPDEGYEVNGLAGSVVVTVTGTSTYKILGL